MYISIIYLLLFHLVNKKLVATILGRNLEILYLQFIIPWSLHSYNDYHIARTRFNGKLLGLSSVKILVLVGLC